MNDDPAKARFLMIQATRIAGVAMAIVGLLVIAGKVNLPPVAGYVLIAVGLIDAMIVPLVLSRKWRSPRP